MKFKVGDMVRIARVVVDPGESASELEAHVGKEGKIVSASGGEYPYKIEGLPTGMAFMEEEVELADCDNWRLRLTPDEVE